MAIDGTQLPFDEALEFFRRKLNLPTERWDDLLGAARDRAFTVAGAMKADLLEDLRAAVENALAEGQTAETFQKNFERIAAERGWTGWTGSDTAGGRAWRARIVYDTNVFTSYSAGRRQQLEAVADERPWWRYRHSDASVVPRPEHLAWDGIVLRHDDPWWAAHTPPSGFGCRCFTETLSDKDLQRLKLMPTAEDEIPYNRTVTRVDPRTGEEYTVPEGIDRGWDYAPGASVGAELAQLAKDKATGLALAEAEARLAKAYVRALVAAPLFARFFAGDLAGEYPLAVLDGELRQTLDTQQPVVVLSQETVDAHRHHPEVDAGDYVQAQEILDQGELYAQRPGRIVALGRIGEKLYRAALKRTDDREKNYWLTLFLTDEEKADREVRDKFKRIRRASPRGSRPR